MKVALAGAVLAAAVTRTWAGSATELEIAPGPAVMSEAEKAIVTDVAKDLEHGVVLIEETVRNDDYGSIVEISYHLRAKILSPEGRGLADVVISTERGEGDLRTWWGRTILPDGQVKELPENELKSQSVAKSASGERRELRGALPGVVPGCVIDYGYVIHVEGYQRSTRVFLQRSWPVRSLRYRWIPDHGRAAAYVLSRSEGLSVAAKYDSKSVLVTAQNLNPVPEEPHMPPLDEARASATFYYTSNDKSQEFWDLEAKRAERSLKSFFGGSWIMKEVLADLHLSPDASLDDRLRATYAWIGQNVKNTRLMSAEEEEAADRRDNEAYTAKRVLQAKEASPRQLAYLFAGMARGLGAEANVVYAVDRTDRFWNKSLKSMDQFSYALVAVRAPGAPDDQVVLVDAGSGLPYGIVPWEATGTAALVCTPKGSASIVVPPASPRDNRSDVHVALAFSDDNETMTATWDRRSIGASGMGYRRWLRNLNIRERKETLDKLCGAAGMTEVTSATLPHLEEPSAPFQIACVSEDSSTQITDAIDRYTLHVSGPWWTAVPEFTAATRVHPIVFDYPQVELIAIDVTAPHGFQPKPAPAPIKLESPYGRYEFVAKATPTGFHVDRAFALTVLTAKAAEYDALRKFLDDVRNADRTPVSFERTGETK
jgi:hypothetical protein